MLCYRHATGPHKNDPGRSRDLYAKFSDLFAASMPSATPASAEAGAKAGGGKLRFEVADVDGCGRAVVRQLDEPHASEAYFLCTHSIA